MESDTLLNDFQEKLGQLKGGSFELFVVDVLRATGRFSNITRNAVIGWAQIDIAATEADSISNNPRRWIFELKAMRMMTADVVLHIGMRKQDLLHHDPNIKFVLVVSGQVTQAARSHADRLGLEVWDALKLAGLTTEKIALAYFGERTRIPHEGSSLDSKAASLIASLHRLPPGRSDWGRFQQLSSEILEYLFCPPLEPPRYEFSDAEARHRRDMIFENSSVNDFWNQVRDTYGAHYIVADAKNYGAPLKKHPVLDIAHYLKSYGCGLFGLLLCRKGAGVSTLHALREQWIGGQKMIIVLSDSELEEMLRIKGQGGKPEEIIRKAIADFRMSLYKIFRIPTAPNNCSMVKWS